MPVSKAWKLNMIERCGEVVPLVKGSFLRFREKGKMLAVDVE